MPASRSLIALIAGTVVLFALVFVELKPGSSGTGGSGSSSSQGLGGYQSDINKAKHAVGVSNASNAASGNENAGSSSAGTSAASSGASKSGSGAAKPGSSSTAKPSSKGASKPAAAKTAVHPATAAENLSTVKAAMSAHKVVAMLFYNPGAADDQAVKQELGSVPTHHGRVVKLAIPLSQAANFTAVTQQVPLNFSPTLVLIAPNRQAAEILGYSDTFEIDQRVADALAAN